MAVRLGSVHEAVKFLKRVDPYLVERNGLVADFLYCLRAHGEAQTRLARQLLEKAVELLENVRPADPADQEKQMALLAEFRDPGPLLSNALGKIPPKHAN